MRYRFFSGERLGQRDHVLVYEREGGVYRFQTLRISAVSLPAPRLEDATPAMVDIDGPCVVSPIETAPTDAKPFALYQRKMLGEHPVRPLI